jgi:hypothetical protein
MTTTRQETVYATDRAETDSCQKGTPGCAVDHPATGPETDCETW